MKRFILGLMVLGFGVCLGCSRPNEKIGTDIHNHELQRLCRYYSEQCLEGMTSMCSMWHGYCQ